MQKLSPIRFNKIWGYELWLACDLPCAKNIATSYPLLVKIITSNAPLSVQVHPDDNSAKILENASSVGKTECWYIMDAAPHSKLIYGLNDNCTKDILESAIKLGTIESCLKSVEIHPKDFIFIPSGTVHAIGEGITLLEVQQSCDITYRLYDYNRGRPLDIKKALAATKIQNLPIIEQFTGEFTCDYFTLKTLDINSGEFTLTQFSHVITNNQTKPNKTLSASSLQIQPLDKLNAHLTHLDNNPFEPSLQKSPLDTQLNLPSKLPPYLIFILNGSGTISSGSNTFQLQKYDTIAIDATEKVIISGSVQLMKITAS